MLAITVETENGQRHIRITPQELAGLVRRIGGENDEFLVVQRIPDLPHVFIQVAHRTGGDYTLEYRDGAPDRHFQVILDGPEPVIAAMTGWARMEDGWETGLGWVPLDLWPGQDPVLPLALDDGNRERLEKRVRRSLVGGYATRADLVELAEEYLVSGDSRPVSPEQARRLVDRMWVERVEEQSAWEGETDPDRLTRAFTALEAAGITAQEDFTCCRSCGQAEIGDVASPDARGFVYFHSQCTDAAADGHGLTILYGGFDGSPVTTTSIGREVVAALGEAGLSVVWNGEPEQVITITPLDWRKRLVG
ncbi:DUF6891 domain-containing protein [Acrocarpospora macrocephala]|nr:hypothetical protein [Acrocarpospora macrocephala]